MNLFKKCNGRLDSQTIYEISKGMLRSIEFIHNLGFIHRDIKPQNFVAGRGYDENAKDQIDDEIYLVDFGLAREYMVEGAEKGQDEHVRYEIDRKIRGTFMYMSVNVILGIEPSRRDDLESLMYVMVLFLKGRLPWHNINVTRKNFEELVMAKISTEPDKLFEKLPKELKEAFVYIRKLKFE
jgi:serine/threonine protein kinase